MIQGVMIQGESGMFFLCRTGWSSISKRDLLFLVTTLLLLFPSLTTLAQAQELRLQFSPATTAISFTLGDILHTVHGSFNLKSGDVKYDPGTAAVHGSLVV